MGLRFDSDFNRGDDGCKWVSFNLKKGCKILREKYKLYYVNNFHFKYPPIKNYETFL
jgi:hypothetical protein